MKHNPKNAFAAAPATRSLPSDAAMPVIESPDGSRYGRELAIGIHDELDGRMDAHIAALGRGFGYAPKILDLGGASGFRAHEMSRLGAHVLVVDICDRADSVARRNAESPQYPAVDFLRADLRAIGPRDLPAGWAGINARRLVHWLSMDETARLFAALPAIAGPKAHIALCFQPAPPGESASSYRKSAHNVFYRHEPEAILGLMRGNGYQILAHGAALLPNPHNYAVFARLPGAIPA